MKFVERDILQLWMKKMKMKTILWLKYLIKIQYIKHQMKYKFFSHIREKYFNK